MDGKMNSLIICLYSLKILGALGFNPYLCAQKMNDGMIKRYCFFLFLGMVSLSLWAGPAKRNVWMRLTLSDGSTVMATLCGDENDHYWRSADGKMYVRNFGTKDALVGDLYFSKNSFSNMRQMYRIAPEVIYNLGKVAFGLEYEMTSVQYGSFGLADVYGLANENIHWVANHRLQLMVKYTF